MSDTNQPTRTDPALRLGISACLLGEPVRYDGGHKRDPYLIHDLGRYVEWVPVCPEVECGLPVPRESMRLVGDPANPCLIAPRSGTDHTKRMTAWARKRVEELAGEGLHGFVFKKDSPSSGLFRVRVYDDQGMARREGVGLFAREITRRFPLLPVEEEGRLHDPRLRENFIDRIFTYRRWMTMLHQNGTPGGLVAFHTAHSPPHYRQLGPLVARAGAMPWDERTDRYGTLLMEGMSVLATPGRHYNVLQHLMGFLKNALDAADKAEMIAALEDFRQGLRPLIVPVTLLKHHVRRNPVPEWVEVQVYLNPYPKELVLRNHV